MGEMGTIQKKEIKKTKIQEKKEIKKIKNQDHDLKKIDLILDR